MSALTLDEKLPRNVRLLQLHALSVGAMFVLPVLVPFYRDVIGLGFKEFIIGEAVFSAVMICMEVPSGWLSDMWTRSRTMMLGSLVHALGFVLLLVADSFAGTLVAQGLLGVAISLFSGTNSALMYDSLLSAGQQDKYRRLEGLRHGIGLYSVGIASVIGGFMYAVDPRLPMLATIAVSLAAFAVTLFLREPARHKQEAQSHPLADMIATMRYALRGHAEIAGIILFGAALFATTKNLMWSQQPYYELLALPEKWYGVLMACGFLLAGLGGQFGHVLDGRGGNIRVLGICFVLVFGCALIAGLFPAYWAIPLLMVGSPMWGFGAPRVHAAINNRVGSERRATILSTFSLMVHMFSIPLFVVMGMVSGAYGVATALIVLACIMAAAGIGGLSLIVRKARHMLSL